MHTVHTGSWGCRVGWCYNPAVAELQPGAWLGVWLKPCRLVRQHLFQGCTAPNGKWWGANHTHAHKVLASGGKTQREVPDKGCGVRCVHL